MIFSDEEEEDLHTDGELEEFGKLFTLHADAERKIRIDDLVGQMLLESWDRGFDAALNLLRARGAVDIAKELESLRGAYWRTQGVD